ncbi:hypothetical protein FJV76_29335 [Mesorhizobium sp. WSM4303]|uniref:hypothetical protein n=1 Tax=unclassified Mesorhizobium TaxID=325217 RepID=UPI00115CE44D|nr:MULTISPECIES: hypothetical protein [unclassified Mesorhizobium]TRC92189.1 hypothetical protein FJV77_25920 [Mesorhizobium sp. WSM4306]TRC95577.1 hypothetical protein FJV76_29335 [Mesorhizobium sp. WSM4303]
MTDLTPPEHQHSAIIEQAVEFYVANFGNVERPIVPALQRRFGLTAHQAIVVIRETTLRRARSA